MALVRERPGVTVREVGAELGVDPTSLYRIVHRLEERGELRKNGRSLEPAGSG
jgi:DNA-binding MarR family transcriptional regulator